MTPSHSTTRWLSVAVLAAAVLGSCPRALAQDDAPWRFDPDRRVYAPADVDVSALAALGARIARVEQDSTWRFQIALVNATPLRMERLAHDLATRWSVHPEFDRDRTFVIACALERGEVAVLPPSAVRDRLALGPEAVRAAWLGDAATRVAAIEDRVGAGLPRMAELLGDLVDRVAKDVADRARTRDEQRLRALEAHEDARAALERQAPQVSAEITDVELTLIDHAARGFDLSVPSHSLSLAREHFARALDRLRFDPNLARDELTKATRLVAQARVRLDHMRTARARIGAALEEAEQAKASLASAIDPSDPASAAQARRVERAETALAAARQLDAAGRPGEALERVTEALRLARAGMTSSSEPPTEPGVRPQPTGWAWALIGLGFPSLGLFLWGGGLLMARSRALLVLDSLRAAAQRQAERLEAEVFALGTLLRNASTPVPIAVPSALQEEQPRTPSRYAGTTARRLQGARAMLDALVRDWSGLEVGLVRSAVLQQYDEWHSTQSLHAAAAALEDVPRRNIPLAEIRQCAAQIERVQRAPARCARLLEDVAGAVARAEEALEEVLQAGQTTSALDDDFADLIEQAREAALLATSDPLAAILVAQTAVRTADVLIERARRMAAVAQDRVRVEQRLRELAEPQGRLSGASLPVVSAFLQCLVDRACGQLDVGLHAEAATALTQTEQLCRAAATAGRDGSDVLTELEMLRIELSEGHRAYQELEREFGASACRDLESPLLRAAAWIELVEQAIRSGARVSRLTTRLHLIRQGLVAVTGRLLILRGERERVTGALEELRARAGAVGNFAERERASVAPHEFGRLEAVTQAIEDAARAADRPDAVWSDLRHEVDLIADELDAVRGLLGESVLRSRRAARLAKGLTGAIRTAGEILTHHSTEAHPGAEARLAAAREGLAAGEALLGKDASERDRALAELQQAARALHQARALADTRKATGVLSDPGILGDAQHALILAAGARANAARCFVLGGLDEPPEGSERLQQALALLTTDPARALELADGVLRGAAVAIAQAPPRRAAEAGVAFDERFAERKRTLAARLETERLIRQGELHRRARFEILGLGEEPDLAAVEGDLDAEDDEEAAALEEATDEEATGSADEPAPGEPATPEAEASASAAPESAAAADPSSGEEPSPDDAPEHGETPGATATPATATPGTEVPSVTDEPETPPAAAETEAAPATDEPEAPPAGAETETASATDEPEAPADVEPIASAPPVTAAAVPPAVDPASSADVPAAGAPEATDETSEAAPGATPAAAAPATSTDGAPNDAEAADKPI